MGPRAGGGRWTGAALAVCAIAVGVAELPWIPERWRFLVAVTGAIACGLGLGVWATNSTSRTLERALRAERMARAEWLHDIVCAEIRVARLRASDPDSDRGSIEQVLADLEHQIRLQQLDESLDAGSVRLSEVVQPFIRRLQDYGVAVTKAPTFGEGRVELDEQVGRRLRHTLSVLVNNAILAGARGVSLRVEHVGSMVEVEVADDAGGFDLGQVPAGRALDLLAGEVSSLNVEPSRHGEGISVRVRIDAASGRRVHKGAWRGESSPSRSNSPWGKSEE